nr:ClC family H(+)/Cl(-) exchange transporter [Clostridia bacterium]
MTTNKKNKWQNVYANAVQLIFVGIVTGVFAGAVVTIYNIFAKKGEIFSREWYAYIRENPVFIPLLLLALAIGAFLLSVAVYLVPMIQGSGIPQTEGATRGRLRFKWYREAVAMFAASLLSIFMGLSAGSEGPSLQIGAASGDTVASVLKRNEMIRRYQVTGGACAGHAVAFNAPLTGMAFAFEEAHKRFTPEVFICAFSSVIFALLTRKGLYRIFGLQETSFFQTYVFPQGAVTDWKFYIFLLLSSLACGLAGVLFFRFVFLLRGLFDKLPIQRKFVKMFVQILIAVLLGGLISLFTVNVMGGGHELIESLGTLGGAGEQSVTRVFTLPLIATLVIVCILKFAVTGLNMSTGIPCGAFIPMLAIGACLGSLLNLAWVKLGMNPIYCDFLVMICMAAFFTSIVKAPITGIVMVCELTWNFSALLPVIIGVAAGYLIGDLTRTDGIYEAFLEAYEEENGVHEKDVVEIFTIEVLSGALADGRTVRDILWPAGASVKEIRRGEEIVLPKGDTVIRGGDILTIYCTTDAPEKIRDELQHILT